MALPRRRVVRRHRLSAALALLLVAACAAGAPAARKVVANTPDPERLAARRADLPDGQYSCSIADGGYQYPSFPCVVATRDGKVRLEKVAGSQRIRGDVTMTENGFHFEGEFFCPHGDCTEPVVTEFRRQGNEERHYLAEIRTASGVIQFDLRYRPEAPGGGGDAYGGKPHDRR